MSGPRAAGGAEASAWALVVVVPASELELAFGEAVGVALAFATTAVDGACGALPPGVGVGGEHASAEAKK